LRVTRRQFVAGSTLALGSTFLRASPMGISPKPFGALPSSMQLAWSRLETYAFLHFSVNTFTDLEWGLGDEDPNVFNPTAFDPDAIVLALKNAGMKAVIFTCKHHDGFCLWPTKTTEHSIRKSVWKDGKGDVVCDISNAARRHGLKFGVYVSPWDRNNANYGKPEYLPIYRAQITELLSNYGPIFEVWFDGANGGDGYYGGAREKRSIDKNYYEWPRILELVHRLQPEAVVFGAAGDIRWVGNEKGIAGETCWATYTPGKPSEKKDIHASDWSAALNSGTRLGEQWKPAECDVSIRPGWFYHASEDSQVRTPENLIDLYFESVGRGASLLLNFPPNRQGLISPQDAAAGAAFHERCEALFAKNLAENAVLRASNIRGNAREYAPRNLVDGDPNTFWATDDNVPLPEIVVDFQKPVLVDVVRLREATALGQRIAAIAIDTWKNEAWEAVASATSIGSCRLLRFSQSLQTERLRLRITDSPVAPALSELGVYSWPAV